MRRAYKVWLGVAAGVFCLVAAIDLSTSGVAPRAPVAAGPAAVPTAPAPAAAAPAAETVAVTRVVDGDTLVVSGGERVRVLGIDSCESATAGGRAATADATALLRGATVTLTREPGVDRDRYGRALRYVTLPDGRDFGQAMVALPETGVHAGGNNASAAYLATLRAADDGPRQCTAAAPSPPPAPVGTSGGNVDWPSPGDQGLPDGALTGGYCAHKWWC